AAGERNKAESANAVCVSGECHRPPPEPLKLVKAPEVSGTPAVGSTLTCNEGTWGGSGISFTFIWLRDGSVAIKGAHSKTYNVLPEDETHSLSCRVTATTTRAEEASAESSNSLQVKGTPPSIVPSKPPEVLGVA